jgi:hypothetical protein
MYKRARLETEEPTPTVREREPIFNAPAIVMAVLGAFVAVHLVRQLLIYFVSEAADDGLVQLLAFDPTRLGGGSAAGGPAAAATQFVTHVFTHGDFTHLLINSAWFLAFATPWRAASARRGSSPSSLVRLGRALLYLLQQRPHGRRVGCDLRPDGRCHPLPVRALERARHGSPG